MLPLEDAYIDDLNIKALLIIVFVLMFVCWFMIYAIGQQILILTIHLLYEWMPEVFR